MKYALIGFAVFEAAMVIFGSAFWIAAPWFETGKCLVSGGTCFALGLAFWVLEHGIENDD